MRPSSRPGSDRLFTGQITVEHPELDEPEGKLSWEQWLEGRQRLETALLLSTV